MPARAAAARWGGGVTPAEVNEFQGLLDAARESAEAAIASLHEGGRRTVDEDGGEAGGVGGDSAAITFDREFGEGLEEGALQRLEEIDHALQRLAAGSYGICERCGSPISSERLHARPWATLCIDDQRLADRR
jgi:RNA polymerase-binding transcription factor